MTGPPDGSREYPAETVALAQERYCVLRFSYEKTAQALKEQEGIEVAVSTLKRWGQLYAWSRHRAMIAQARAEMAGDFILARSAMLKELIAEKNPIVGFSVAKLEELALKQEAAAREGKRLRVKELKRREINSKADAVKALQEAVEFKLSRMLVDPEETNFATIQNILKAQDAIDQLSAKDKKPAKDKGLTAEQADLIRNRILGGG